MADPLAKPEAIRPDQVRKLGVAEGPRARPFAFAVLGLVLAGLAATSAANVLVDPRAEFGTDLLPPAVPDEVHFRLELYEEEQPPPAHVVLGSSRARLFQGLPGLHNETFNLALHGGTVSDQADLFAYLVRTGNAPTSVIVVLDQAAFTPAFTDRVPVSPDADRVTGEPVPAYRIAGKVVASWSSGYVRDTLRSLWYAYAAGYPEGRGFGDTNANPAFAAPDLEERYRNGTFDPAKVGPGIDVQMSFVFGPSSRFVPERRMDFDRLVQQAAETNTTLHIVVPAIQPVALLDYERRYPDLPQRLHEVRQALLDACGPGVHAFDYTHVASFGGDAREFLDQTHNSLVNVRLMEDAMARGEGDLCAMPAQ